MIDCRLPEGDFFAARQETDARAHRPSNSIQLFIFKTPHIIMTDSCTSSALLGSLQGDGGYLSANRAFTCADANVSEDYNATDACFNLNSDWSSNVHPSSATRTATCYSLKNGIISSDTDDKDCADSPVYLIHTGAPPSTVALLPFCTAANIESADCQFRTEINEPESVSAGELDETATCAQCMPACFSNSGSGSTNCICTSYPCKQLSGMLEMVTFQYPDTTITNPGPDSAAKDYRDGNNNRQCITILPPTSSPQPPTSGLLEGWSQLANPDFHWSNNWNGTRVGSTGGPKADGLFSQLGVAPIATDYPYAATANKFCAMSVKQCAQAGTSKYLCDRIGGANTSCTWNEDLNVCKGVCAGIRNMNLGLQGAYIHQTGITKVV
jgi:hypothetical protein